MYHNSFYLIDLKQIRRIYKHRRKKFGTSSSSIEKRAHEVIFVCENLLKETDLPGVLSTALRLVRKKRKRKRIKKKRAPPLVVFTKEETYKMMMMNDLTEKQLKGIRKDLAAKRVCII